MRRLRLERLERRDLLASLPLDPNFGDNGVALFAEFLRPGTEWPAALAVQPDGKSLVAGTTHNGHGYSLALARFRTDGSPDPSFGGDGTVNTVLSPGHEMVHAVDVQVDADGGIVVLGQFDEDYYLLRYDEAGELDSSFDSDGILKVESLTGTRFFVTDFDLGPNGESLITAWNGFGPWLISREKDGSVDPAFGEGLGYAWLENFSIVLETVVQSDGKLVVVGSGFFSDAYEYQIGRLLPNGSLDQTYGNQGFQTIAFDYQYDPSLNTAQVQIEPTTDEGIVVAVLTSRDTLSLARLESEGQLVEGFGEAGIATININASRSIECFAVDPSGGLYVALSPNVNHGSDHAIALTRILPSGDLDLDFGTDGYRIHDLEEGNWDQLVGLTFSEGYLMGAAAFAQNHREHLTRMSAVRFDTSGALDPTFGDGGWAVAVVSEESRGANPVSAVVQPDGKTVVALRNGYDYKLRRFHLDGTLDLSFGTNGEVLLTEDYRFDGRVLALDNEGRVLVGGGFRETAYTVYTNGAVARLNADGSFDQSFGVAGIAKFSGIAGFSEWTQEIHVDSEGSILAAVSESAGFSFIRLSNAGQLDASFGQGQVPRFHSEDGHLRLVGFTMLADGRLQFVAQDDAASGGVNTVVLGVLGSSGVIDSSYAQQGYAVLNLPDFVLTAQAIAWQSDESVVIGGSAFVLSPNLVQYAALMRVAPTGELDVTFGNQGISLLQAQAGSSRHVSSLHILRDDRIIAVEQVAAGSLSTVQVTSVLASGELNPVFGGGTLTFSVNEYPEIVADSVLLSDSSLLLVGSAKTYDTGPLFLAKAQLISSEWQNPVNPLNVSGDSEGTIAPIDALLIINALNDTAAGGARQLGPRDSSATSFYDVNGDGWVTAIDALMVINWLNQNPVSLTSAPAETSAKGEADYAQTEDGIATLAEPSEFDSAAIAWLLSDFESREKRR